MYCIYLFIFAENFTLIRDTVDLESVLQRLDTRWQYILDWMAVNHRASCTHIKMHTQTHTHTTRKQRTRKKPMSSGLNWETFIPEASCCTI